MRSVNAEAAHCARICCHSSKLLLAFLAMLAFAAACTAPERSYFEPDHLPSDRVDSALVRTPGPIYRDGKDLIIIKAIDGQKPTFQEDKTIVPPGVHTFQVALEFHHEVEASPDKRYITKADVSLSFDVDANGEYLIDAVENEDGVWLWALDLQTNVVVAGRMPKDLPNRGSTERIWNK